MYKNDYGMYISLTQWSRTVEITEKSSDQSVDDMLRVFEGVLLAQGYHPDSWKRGIMELAEEYRIQQEREESRLTAPPVDPPSEGELAHDRVRQVNQEIEKTIREQNIPEYRTYSRTVPRY